ncbi:hypothetical protein SOVF_116560 [Spinacia oleracea]|uniref:Uncharacterized protein n=1 Tax=Spinacia oleracea TaxID=3562 RepID=A0A9R0IST1_SPIOL|nr:uncharacterized protein LOC110794045 [Spinacia oleracea]KNA13485.1 hypothetical protein SOVF_116560 [Spinacia oleracea]
MRPMNSKETPVEGEVEVEEVEVEEVRVKLGCYTGFVKLVEDPSEEIMLLWGLQQPIFSKPNAFVKQSSLSLHLDAFGHSISVLQSPSSLMTPGVTGSVMWDSGIVLGKFLEHAVDSERLLLQGKKIVELGSGCGLVGCIAALSGAQVTLTDLPDRLRLLKKNVDTNLDSIDILGSGMVSELIWGEDPDPDILDPLPDYVLGSDVIYSEGAVGDLLSTLQQLCGRHTTAILSGELRNDAVLEYFLESAIKDFSIGQVDQMEFHPEYRSHRVVIYILVKRSNEECTNDN